MKKENSYQASLISKIEKMFPGCYVLKNDPNRYQGIPDLLILYENKWACLETKKSNKESYRPNQEYYIKDMNKKSFCRMICPENENEVFYDLQRALKS